MEENDKIQARHELRRDIVNEMVKTLESPQPDEIAIKYTPDQQIKEWVASISQRTQANNPVGADSC